MSVRITDNWTEFGKAFKKEMKKMEAKPYVKVGFPAGQAFEEPKEQRDSDGDILVIDEITVGMVAIFNEFGTWSIPERSFLRATVDEKRKEIQEFIAQTFYEIVIGKYTTEQGLNRIGIFGVKLVVEKIDSFVDPKNADSTILKKGSSLPLFDTGQMRATLLAQGWQVNMPKA